MMRFFISGSASAALASALTLATIAAGVVAGTITPVQLVIVSCGNPSSAVVGTSGSSGWRSLLVTASARSLPLFTCGSDSGKFDTMRSICPPMRSVSDGVPPL